MQSLESFELAKDSLVRNLPSVNQSSIELLQYKSATQVKPNSCNWFGT